MATSRSDCIKIEVTDLETNITTTYISMNQAAKALSCHISSIAEKLNSKSQKPFKGRYILKRL